MSASSSSADSGEEYRSSAVRRHDQTAGEVGKREVDVRAAERIFLGVRVGVEVERRWVRWSVWIWAVVFGGRRSWER